MKLLCKTVHPTKVKVWIVQLWEQQTPGPVRTYKPQKSQDHPAHGYCRSTLKGKHVTRYTFSPLLNAYWHKDNCSIKQEQCLCNYRNRQSELFFRGQLLFLLAVYRNMVIPSSSAALYPHPSQAESLRQRKCISWYDLVEFSLLPMMSCLWNLPRPSLYLFLLCFPPFSPPPAFSPL